MKILAVNGSPNGERGNTEVLVKAFLEGAMEKGAITETIYLKDKRINNCTGCFSCWFKTPGECIHKDDMPEILVKIPEADAIVYATPLYVYSVSGLMKNFMDRLIPMSQPFVDIKDGMSCHPTRNKNASKRSVILISNCGFPEPEHFNGLKETFKCWYHSDSSRIAGMICCAGGVVIQVPELQDKVAWYVDAARQAGREFASEGRISDNTQSILDRPLVEDKQFFADRANEFMLSMGIKRI